MVDYARKTLSSNNATFLDATFKRKIVALGMLNKKKMNSRKIITV